MFDIFLNARPINQNGDVKAAQLTMLQIHGLKTLDSVTTIGLDFKNFKLPADLASEHLGNMLAHCGDNWHDLLRTWCPTYGNKHGVQAHRMPGFGQLDLAS